MTTKRIERTNRAQPKFPLDFFALVIALMIPFWIFGGEQLPIPMKLPISAFAAFTPMIAAVILTAIRQGKTGVQQLFKRVFDYARTKNKAWFLPVLFLYPLVAVLSYMIMRAANLPLPSDPQIPWLMAPIFIVVFFLFGIGEELGWMGYAFDPVQDRWGAIKAGLFFGLFWALIHLVPDLQNGQVATWIFWHRLGTVALRILMVWIYNNTGKSVFAMILFHVAVNMGWAMFPNYGSHYDPFVTTLIILVITGMVLLIWEPHTLARFRFARPHRPETGQAAR